ncbi:MAG TPA: hypothetical protein VFU31_16575, partial [Candidatus Binatia bacterium]|nr:hypothetical protein [Candidatus Binatia bacterium]
MAVVCSPWSVVRFSVALCALLFALCSVAEAQQPKKIARVGFLSAASASSQVPRLIVFRDSLRE